MRYYCDSVILGYIYLGVANGSSKTVGPAKFWSNFTGLAVSFFEWLRASRMQSRFLYEVVSESQNSLKSQSRNLKSQNVSGSQRKTLVSSSRKVSHLPFATPISHEFNVQILAVFLLSCTCGYICKIFNSLYVIRNTDTFLKKEHV